MDPNSGIAVRSSQKPSFDHLNKIQEQQNKSKDHSELANCCILRADLQVVLLFDLPVFPSFLLKTTIPTFP